MQVGGVPPVPGDLPGQVERVVQGGRGPLPKDAGGFPVGPNPDDVGQTGGITADPVPGVEDGERMPCVVVAVELQVPVVGQGLAFEPLVGAPW